MSTLSSLNVMDVNLVLKERTHMRLCLNMVIFTHNLGNWLISISRKFIMSIDKHVGTLCSVQSFGIDRACDSCENDSYCT